MRKNEAATAAAFFSNMDLVDIKAGNESVKEERMSADITKALLHERLRKSIPWFQVVQGGLQEANVQGAAIAHVYWRFEERYKNGMAEHTVDNGCTDLALDVVTNDRNAGRTELLRPDGV